MMGPHPKKSIRDGVGVRDHEATRSTVGGVRYQEDGPIDVEQLQRLYDHAPWARGRSAEGIRRMLEATDYYFSGWDGSRLVAFARVLTDRIYRATLWDVIVDAEYQGRGVGEGLMDLVLNHPVLARVEKFWLNTRDKQTFYERFGFVASSQGMVRERAVRE